AGSTALTSQIVWSGQQAGADKARSARRVRWTAIWHAACVSPMVEPIVHVTREPTSSRIRRAETSNTRVVSPEVARIDRDALEALAFRLKHTMRPTRRGESGSAERKAYVGAILARSEMDRILNDPEDTLHKLSLLEHSVGEFYRGTADLFYGEVSQRIPRREAGPMVLDPGDGHPRNYSEIVSGD